MNNLTEFSTSLAATLIGAKQTVAVAESSTAGLISACLLAVPGASAFFKGGCVIYTLESRKQLLQISRDDVDGLEPLTQAMVMKFAAKAREQLGASWGIAELGAAGPAGTPYGHPPGISVIGIDGPISMSITVETGDDDRERNMWAFTEQALKLFGTALRQQT